MERSEKTCPVRSNGAGFEDFCEEVYARLVGALAHYCGDVYLAEEFAQEALMKAYRRWGTVNELRSPEGWCYRTGVNVANTWFRRLRAERRARSRLQNRPRVVDDPNIADRLVVRAALQRLTRRQREAVILRYYLGLSSEEAAGVLGSTAQAVRATTHRVLVKIRADLQDPVAPPGGGDHAEH